MIWNRLLAIILALSLGIAQSGIAESENNEVSGGNAQQDSSVTKQTTLVADTDHLAGYQQYWHSTSLLQHLTSGQSESSLWDLLRFEYQLGVNTLTNLYAGWRRHLNHAANDDSDSRLGHYNELIRTILTLLLAATIFTALHRLARRSTTLLLHISDQITSKAPKQRWAKALARLFSSTAPLAPWLLLWLALTSFTTLFSGSNAALLNWWAPLAELYIIYGLLCLTGEWLLLRISTGAGVFLGSEQNKQLTAHQAAWLIWPWISLYFINHWLGASLIYRVGELLAWLVVWFALAALVKARQQDYLTNLKNLLPERLDPLIDRLSSAKLFLCLATLLLPLQLLQFLLQYVDQLFIDFDWYRSLSARWFRMRTKVLVDQDTEETSDEEVPQQYERWFRPEGDGEKDFPTISTGLSDAIRKPVDAWLAQRTDENSLIVTGEKGIGKTSALSRLEKAISEDNPKVRVHRIAVPAKTTSQEAVYKLIGDLIDADLSEGPAMLARTDAERAPTLVILDEAQNLFLADVDHLDGWRTLLNLTNVRVENIFWIVSINNQSWAYLCNVFGREYQIRNAIRAKRWSQNEIRSLILSRNHLSGYKLRYDDILLSSRGSEAGNLRNAEQRYFSLLWDSCRGVPMTALGMWLTSVRPQGRIVTVGLPQTPSSAVLEKLGSKLMFVYAAIVTHENLTFEEVLRATNQQENVVRYALKSALDAEFIERSEDGRYRIASLWYQTVISYLARKNMLNE
jgi:hypothetical protein